MHAFECTDDFAGPHRQALFSEIAGHPLARVVRAIFCDLLKISQNTSKARRLVPGLPRHQQVTQSRDSVGRMCTLQLLTAGSPSLNTSVSNTRLADRQLPDCRLGRPNTVHQPVCLPRMRCQHLPSGFGQDIHVLGAPCPGHAMRTCQDAESCPPQEPQGYRARRRPGGQSPGPASGAAGPRLVTQHAPPGAALAGLRPPPAPHPEPCGHAPAAPGTACAWS